MADENSMAHGSSDCPSNEAQDLRDQGSVLIHVLTLYPTHLRLTCAQTHDGAAFSQWSGCDGAVCH